ncbi:hypothetical protein FSP39_017991 [Pinctada imbricata]|uniref:Oxidoreductase FAD/NAD(P)-binding domain-containing protein n=1 Tax=Pinctada imbricata TaxID=66713 RepID=A0AA88YTJ6_PINIB|nr:hypothetical protein FSP39_017991 [Pinctada imbricata]
MSSKSDHLQRTADNTRENVVSMATIIGMRDESKTVKSLKLKVHDKRVAFKAGQWVDMFIPGVDKVGGFSMWSRPSQLLTDQTLDLAIKYSDHPPAMWVHTECKVGTEVHVRVGGDIYFDRDASQNLERKDPNLLLIAGGIGINPIISIMSHVADLKTREDNSDSGKERAEPGYSGKCALLYSSSTVDELLFKDHILSICESFPHDMKYYLHATQEGSQLPDSIRKKRIDDSDLQECLTYLGTENILTYICGPPPMIHSIEEKLLKMGLQQNQILYEKWW